MRNTGMILLENARTAAGLTHRALAMLLYGRTAVKPV